LQGYYAPGDGGGGMLNWIPTDMDTVDNCKTFASSAGSGSAGRWVRDLPDKTINVLQCGAKADGTISGGNDTGNLMISGTDNSPFFTHAIATGLSVFAPCGSYVLNSTVYLKNRGQHFYGSNPDLSATADTLACGTRLIAGMGIGANDLLSLGITSTPGTYSIELDHFSIDGSAMMDAPGNYTANEIHVNVAVHPYIHDIRTTNAWNGIKIDHANSVDLARIDNEGLRGDYNEYCFNGTQILEIMDSNNTGVSPSQVTASATTSNVITVSSTANIWPGMLVTGSGIPDGDTVTSVMANTSVTVLTPVMLTSGTTLIFYNKTFGFYMGDNCNSVLAQYIKSQQAFHAIEINSPAPSTSYPNGFDCFRCGGDIMPATILHDVNGIQVKITQFYGVVGAVAGPSGDTVPPAIAGPAIYQGPNAVDLQLVNPTVAGGEQDGIYVAGSQFRVNGGLIGRNSHGAPDVYCGITFAATAKDAIVNGASIGEYHNGSGGVGQQKYGICSASSTNQQNLLITGNDLRYNDYGPVDNPANYTLGTNTGLGTPNVLLDQSTTTLMANLTGSYSAAHVTAIDTAIRSLKSAGIWNQTDWIGVSLGYSQDSLTNWVSPSYGNFALTAPVPVVSGTVAYSAGPNGGFTSDGTTGWINLGFAVTSLANCQMNSCAMFVGSNTDIGAVANSYDLTSMTSHNSSIIGRMSSGLLVHANSMVSGTNTLASTAGVIYGWSRTASGAYTSYASGSALGSHTDPSSTLSTSNMGLLGDGTNFSTRQIWFSWIGGALTNTQAAQLNTIMNTLKASW
jgi:hypothetical protein